MNADIYTERRENLIAATRAYASACGAHAARLNSSDRGTYFLSDEAFANRAAIKKANRAREKARRIFVAVATVDDQTAMLQDALAEAAAFAHAISV